MNTMATVTFLLILAVLLVSVPTNGYRVQIYRELHYKGLIYDFEGDDEACHEVKEYGKGSAGSLRSNTCLMLYEGTSCSGYSYKLAKDKPEVSDLRRTISSFQQCNENYGGSKIHVQMFNGTGHTIADYQNICSCQDLPSQVTTQLTSLNNYGNCIVAYSSDSCSESSKEIPAGINGVSQALPELGWYIRSISGCGNRRGCVKLSASIFKFILNPSDDQRLLALASTSQELDLATKTTFYNNGSATVFQTYEATSKVRDSSTIELSKTITSMESHKTEHSLNKGWGVSLDIPGVLNIGVNVQNGLEKGYTTENTESNSETNTYTHEEENEFTVRQIIRVPPCTEYTVSAMVQMSENYPIVYDVYTKVTGEAGGRKMTGEEVRQYVGDGMTFVEMLDEYTAVYKDRKSAVASVGLEATVSGEGTPIEWCGETPRN